jgi:YedE family putative selenium metabolism protein
VGAIRDVVLMRDRHLLNGVIALVVFAFITNLILGQFYLGIADQPVAHTSQWWNVLGMVLAGFAFTLSGGCPGRHLIMSGEGNADSGLFVIGMIVGAGFAHQFSAASSPAGPGTFGPLAVAVGLVVCLAIGLTMRQKAA